jgi:hypothetical protein
MATVNNLIGIGMAAELAKRVGFTPVAVATTAATQGTGALRGAGNKLVSATFTTAADAVTLPSDAEIGDEIIISNITANAGVIFPPTGGNINGNTVNTSVAITAQGAASATWRFIKLNATRWIGFAAADAT